MWSGNLLGDNHQGGQSSRSQLFGGQFSLGVIFLGDNYPGRKCVDLVVISDRGMEETFAVLAEALATITPGAMIRRGIYPGCKCPGQYSSRAIIRREIIRGAITQMIIVQGAIFLGDNYPGSNNPGGNHAGGNCLWGNHPGCAIVRGWQFSLGIIIIGDNFPGGQ